MSMAINRSVNKKKQINLNSIWMNYSFDLILLFLFFINVMNYFFPRLLLFLSYSYAAVCHWLDDAPSWAHDIRLRITRCPIVGDCIPDSYNHFVPIFVLTLVMSGLGWMLHSKNKRKLSGFQWLWHKVAVVPYHKMRPGWKFYPLNVSTHPHKP